jgi:hypothetical protein
VCSYVIGLGKVANGRGVTKSLGIVPVFVYY